jgi:hypothetical protein
MTEKVKFVCITRTIDSRTGTHYLDALDSDGNHYTAQMSDRIEKWLVFTKRWRKEWTGPIE